MISHKQCIVVRNDLKLSCGKLCAQVAHASLIAYLRAQSAYQDAWMSESGGNMTKIILVVESEERLLKVEKDACAHGISNFLVRDAGYTEVPPGTVTALGLGPAESKLMNKVTGKLCVYGCLQERA